MGIAPYAILEILRHHRKRALPFLGRLLFLFTLLRGLRRTACGLVSAIATAARTLGRVTVCSSLRLFSLRLALLILARGARLLVVRPLFALRLTRLRVGLLRRLLGGFTLRSCFRRAIGALAAASSSAAAAVRSGGLVARFRLLRHLRR